MGRKSGKYKKQKISMAEQADRHVLYEESVQNAEFEIDFVIDTFRTIRNRMPYSLREDFCGTANACCEWVRRDDAKTAVGVDLDPDVLAWGREHHVAALQSRQAARVSLLNRNVLDVETEPADVLLAMNFSYWCFKNRPLLLQYFRRAYVALKDDGVFFLDAFGGYESYQELEEETEHDEFTYVWDQAKYDPYTNDFTAHIHFKFPDGSKLKKAFTYDWRIWSLPELRELLEEAGFKKITVYAQGWDEEEDEETDEFLPVDTLDADPGWVAYISAEK